MAIEQTQFQVAETTVGKRQGYLCYLRDKPYKLFLKPDAKRSVIHVMARTGKYTVDLGIVPDGVDGAISSVMGDGKFVYINESQIVRTSGSSYAMKVSAGWYA